MKDFSLVYKEVPDLHLAFGCGILIYVFWYIQKLGMFEYYSIINKFNFGILMYFSS